MFCEGKEVIQGRFSEEMKKKWRTNGREMKQEVRPTLEEKRNDFFFNFFPPFIKRSTWSPSLVENFPFVPQVSFNYKLTPWSFSKRSFHVNLITSMPLSRFFHNFHDMACWLLTLTFLDFDFDLHYSRRFRNGFG